jgi:hypothetical protein
MKPIRKFRYRFPFEEPKNYSGLHKQVDRAPFRQVAEEVWGENMFLALDVQFAMRTALLTMSPTEEIRH